MRRNLSRFVDSLRVKFRGGRGGDGCISMLSVFANEFAGPDGGNGGSGGHVVLRASPMVKSFNGLFTTYYGSPGGPGMGKCMYGANASHIFVDVPVGTVVALQRPQHIPEHEFDPDKSDLVAQLDQAGSMFIAARGGAGGRGNASYLSNKNRHPRIAERGAMGEERTYELRLQIYAHIGLIGLPNVGKSTLLKSLTRANVKIGDYSFTTLHPQVGILEYPDFTQIAISDLPGLIEDSHKNRGLGLRFLRHVQRCVCLLYVLDMTANPILQLETLFDELEAYKKGLSKRPHLILGNKIDDPRSVKNIIELSQYVAHHRPDTKVVYSSSLRGDNLNELKIDIKRVYDEHLAKNASEPDEALIW